MLDIKTLAAAKKQLEKTNNNDEFNAHIKNSNIHITSEEREKLNKDFNDQTPTFTQTASRQNIASGDKLSTIFGKIKKWLSDLKSVAFTGSYSDLVDTPAETRVKGEAENSYRTGDVNITKENIGLENVDNTSDVNKKVASAVNADMVDGKHSSDFFGFIQHTGGTITEALRETGIHSGASGTIGNINTDVYETLSNIIVFNGGDGYGNVQIGIVNPVGYGNPRGRNLVYTRAQISYGNDWTEWSPLGSLSPIILIDGGISIRGGVVQTNIPTNVLDNYCIKFPEKNTEIFHMRIFGEFNKYRCILKDLYIYASPSSCDMYSDPILIYTEDVLGGSSNSEYMIVKVQFPNFSERIITVDGKNLISDFQLYRLEILSMR